jgi:uncharacterized repeat protein (TIGR01451 family)
MMSEKLTLLRELPLRAYCFTAAAGYFCKSELTSGSPAREDRSPLERSAPGDTRLAPLSNQSGQVVVLVAIVATVLFSMMAFVVDIGAAYQTRRALQSSADSGALAAAMDVAEGRGNQAAVNTAKRYVNQNLTEPAKEIVVTFPQNSKVKVEAHLDQPTFFARIMGYERIPVSAEAVATIGLASKVPNLLPFMVPFQRVAGHLGPENLGRFELGEDRPMGELSIIYAQSGNRVTYTVTFVNADSVAVDVVAWSPIPTGAAYVSGSATGGGSFDGTNVRWEWPGIAAGDRRSANYVVEFSGSVNVKNDVFASVNGGQTITASTDGGAQKGYFWLSNFEGSGSNVDFRNWIVDGYPEMVGLDGQASGTGVRSTLTSAMSERIAKDASVVLPLYDYTQGGGSKGTYSVVGFVEFVITDFRFTGNPKWIEGYFTDGRVVPGVGGGTESPVDYGIKAIWLSD